MHRQRTPAADAALELARIGVPAQRQAASSGLVRFRRVYRSNRGCLRRPRKAARRPRDRPPARRPPASARFASHRPAHDALRVPARGAAQKAKATDTAIRIAAFFRVVFEFAPYLREQTAPCLVPYGGSPEKSGSGDSILLSSLCDSQYNTDLILAVGNDLIRACRMVDVHSVRVD